MHKTLTILLLIVAVQINAQTMNRVRIQNLTTNLVSLSGSSGNLLYVVFPMSSGEFTSDTTNFLFPTSIGVMYFAAGKYGVLTSQNLTFFPASSENVVIQADATFITMDMIERSLGNRDTTFLNLAAPYVAGFGIGLTLIGFGWMMQIIRKGGFTD